MTLRRWGAHGALSLVDHAVFSGANLALSLCYARWLPLAQYGLFSILLALYMLASIFHNSLILEPMSILGTSQGEVNKRGYVSGLMVLNGWVTLLPSVALAIAAAISLFTSPRWSSSFVAASFSIPLILLLFVLRRLCYLRENPARAARASITYAVVLLALMALTRAHGSAALGIMLMGLASSAGALVALEYADLSRHPVDIKCLARQHWAYSRWSLGAAAMAWINSSLFTPIIGFYSGLEGAAALRATENLVLPVGHGVTALAALLLPWLARRATREHSAWLTRTTIGISAGALLGFGAYGLLLIVGRDKILPLFYRSALYGSVRGLLPVLCLAWIVRAIGDLGVGMSLRATSHPRETLWANLCAAAVSLGLGAFLIRQFGPVGAVWTILVASVVQVLVMTQRFGATLYARPEIESLSRAPVNAI